MIVNLVLLFVVFVASKSCIEDPTQPSCADYKLDVHDIEKNITMICKEGGMMPEMVGCSVWRICTNTTNNSEKTSVYCEPFSLFKAVCAKMSGMQSCYAYPRLCGNGSKVKECDTKIIPLPSETQLTEDVNSICSDMFMVACEKCETNGKPISCDHLMVYSDLCLVMPSMRQCGIWSQFCTRIPFWGICDSSANHAPRMEMFFHLGYSDYILFQQWVPTTAGTYFASLLVVFLLAVLMEGFKICKQKWEMGWTIELQHMAASSTLLNDKKSYSSHTPFVGRIEICRALLRGFDVGFGYLLMLISMTFNVGLFLALILGFAVGTLLFSVFRPLQQAPEVSEGCH